MMVSDAVAPGPSRAGSGRGDASGVAGAARACIAGALITVIGGLVTQLVWFSSSVSEDVWSFPWTSDQFLVVSPIWAISHLLVVGGIYGLHRRGVAGHARSARVGIVLAILGTLALALAELAGIPIREQDADSGGSVAVGTLFGLGTLLTGVGLVLAGRRVLAEGLWDDWRRLAPIGTGVAALVLVVLALTPVISLGVAALGMGYLALGIALLGHP